MHWKKKIMRFLPIQILSWMSSYMQMYIIVNITIVVQYLFYFEHNRIP